ncbi:MAG: zf-HC2 domain-containing protein [Butyrivibrio sp.]|nr:zf-HC2 domain-containing protein [Acetatifactor muris]MCM1560596.1 zf-HC2 domain-containing protein [Butyrivibrio sp.]
MDCKEFEKLIPGFIQDGLDYSSMKRFCQHMEQCDNCREELVIQFLVTEGVQRLEDGRAFDLQKELDRRLSRIKKKIKVHGNMIRLGIVMEIGAAGILIGIALRIFT